MTFREKLKQEHPECINPDSTGGCRSCPCSYGYENDIPTWCKCNSDICTYCWDREIPEEKTEDIIDEIMEMTMDARPLTPTEVIECFYNTVRGEDAPATIKDSGARREFESGAVRDIQEGKGRCDLLPLDVVAMYFRDEIIELISSFKNTGDYNCLLHVLDLAPSYLLYDSKAELLLEVSIHFEDGAKKYGEYNWQKGIPVHCYIDSAVRHYLKHLRGDVDEYHDRAFVWNILCCIWTCIHKPELNEYKKPETNN